MKKIIFLLPLFFFFACKKDDSMDPKLLGKWTDSSNEYIFRQDFTYSNLYLRKGKGPDTVTVDSVFGIISLDRKRNNITFNMKGFREKYTGIIHYQNRYANTWNYTFVNDSTLNYTSNTTAGVFNKIK